MRTSKSLFGLFSAVSFFSWHQSTSPSERMVKSEASVAKRRQYFEDFVSNLQSQFTNMIESYEYKEKFNIEKWQRSDKNGKGISGVLQEGEMFEKVGFNIIDLALPFQNSADKNPNSTLGKHLQKLGKKFDNEDELMVFGVGLNLFAYPVNPFVPSVHANFRYFEIFNRSTGETVDFWFGGCADLTPSYLFKEDCVLFHVGQKKACDLSKNPGLYKELKAECDKHFFLPHRKEHIGVGGIYYDDIVIDGDWDKTFRFVSESAKSCLSDYGEIVERRRNISWNERNLKWRELRMGRIVEYKLLCDNATKGGILDKNQNAERILMSLPRIARWEFCQEIEQGSEEAEIMKLIRRPVDWI